MSNNCENLVLETSEVSSLEQIPPNPKKKKCKPEEDLRSILCDICNKENSKYSFKCCLWKFCSSKCFREHRESVVVNSKCCGPPRLSAEELALNASAKTVGRDQHQFKIMEQQYLEELGSLTEEDKKKIKNDPRVQKAISCLAYRKSITQIVNSPNCIDQLARHMVNPEFAMFISYLQEVLDENFMPLEPTPQQTLLESIQEKLLISD